MATYFGASCITSGCDGHKAGAVYVRRGGRLKNNKSPSFTSGMGKQAKRMRKRGTAVRLR
jgi:hypothetical protein|tara:strand:+ start:60 stop:239 length:180 start_codon:yes stop_codon:yes gene_type:complete